MRSILRPLVVGEKDEECGPELLPQEQDGGRFISEGWRMKMADRIRLLVLVLIRRSGAGRVVKIGL